MQSLSLTELCERWAPELQIKPEDLARTLALYLSRWPDHDENLAFRLVPPLDRLPIDRRANPTELPPGLEESVDDHLIEIAHEGREVKWELLRLAVIDASDFAAWLSSTTALPPPRFWPSEPGGTAEAPSPAGTLEPADTTVAGAPSASAVLNALAVITHALADTRPRYWKSDGKININVVVTQVQTYLELHPEVKDRLGPRAGLGKSSLAAALAAAMRQLS